MEIDTLVSAIKNEKLDLELETPPSKCRKKKSMVWEHFTVKAVGDGIARAFCKQCKKSFAYMSGSKVSGTSHLKRHISLGICPASRQKNMQSPLLKKYSSGDTALPKKRVRATPGLGVIPFDQERCNNEVAKMIIALDHPLQIVEHKGFIDFVRTLQPQFSSLSSTDVQGDCISMYLSEKQNLLNLIRQIPGRVNLTLDLWTSNQTVAYAFLRGHFIDSDWNVHHPILNVIMVPFPDSDDSYNKTVVTCLTDWQLNGRVFTLALDQSLNENVMGNLRGLVSARNPVIFNGQLVSRNCFARVLSRLALDALYTMRETIRKIRESVKLVKISESNEAEFNKLRQQLQVPSTKDLFIDNQTKWDTTYHMLVAACELKQVFDCFETPGHDHAAAAMDPRYKMVYVESTFCQVFGETNAEPWIRVVEDGLREILNEYIVELLPLTTTDGDEGNEIMIKTEPFEEGSDGSIYIDTEGIEDFDIYISDIPGNLIKSELDQYLEEPLLPREELDILSWWRLNRNRKNG
ncbi:hypothetical protein K1719_021599 [Acacia pycnantha]|nr:hypothetical protein K1719_021599 [Acacia pycnantha]